MARPKKTGLDYFPLDCHMDNKIEALESEHKLIGFAVYIKLLQEIYQTENGELELNGTFSMWKILGKRLELDENTLRQLLDYMITINLFDKSYYEKGILTSSGIKKRMEKINEARRHDRERKFSNDIPMEKSWKRGESKVNNKGKHIYTENCNEFFDYFCLKTKKNYTLDKNRQKIILSRLEEGRTLEELKRAVDNFTSDTWEDRDKYCDIVYCIGKRNKIDNLEKWLNYKPANGEWRKV